MVPGGQDGAVAEGETGGRDDALEDVADDGVDAETLGYASCEIGEGLEGFVRRRGGGEVCGAEFGG